MVAADNNEIQVLSTGVGDKYILWRWTAQSTTEGSVEMEVSINSSFFPAIPALNKTYEFKWATVRDDINTPNNIRFQIVINDINVVCEDQPLLSKGLFAKFSSTPFKFQIQNVKFRFSFDGIQDDDTLGAFLYFEEISE